jgi:hypothetical protein
MRAAQPICAIRFRPVPLSCHGHFSFLGCSAARVCTNFFFFACVGLHLPAVRAKADKLCTDGGDDPRVPEQVRSLFLGSVAANSRIALVFILGTRIKLMLFILRSRVSFVPRFTDQM